MQKAKEMNTIVITVLAAILIVLVGGIIKSVYDYYTGPDYTVNCYIKYLNERAYHKLYYLLEPEGAKLFGGEDEMADYYKRIYEKENKLLDIEKTGYEGKGYGVQYRYARETEKGILSVKQINRRWYIAFPFEKSEVEVFAPYGATVYLDSRKLTYTQNQCYEIDNILPGNYMIKVDANKEGYKDYYKMIHIPKECKVVTPYEVAHVNILTPAGFKVKLDRFEKSSKKAKIEFDDILLGDYVLEVQDIEGDFVKQSFKVNVTKGDNAVKLEDLELSEQGETKLESFLNNFYHQSLQAIKKHDINEISSFFAGSQAKAQKELFESWYIAKKDIVDAKMQVKLENVYVDEKGQIHAVVTENVELENKEYDEENKEVNREYKVMITWDNKINPLNGIWKISSRNIEESMVAVKDQEGRWVQY